MLEPSVYDLARESARVEGLREGGEEEKQEEQTTKALRAGLQSSTPGSAFSDTVANPVSTVAGFRPLQVDILAPYLVDFVNKETGFVDDLGMNPKGAEQGAIEGTPPQTALLQRRGHRIRSSSTRSKPSSSRRSAPKTSANASRTGRRSSSGA